jgi:hypothetical protein
MAAIAMAFSVHTVIRIDREKITTKIKSYVKDIPSSSIGPKAKSLGVMEIFHFSGKRNTSTWSHDGIGLDGTAGLFS